MGSYLTFKSFFRHIVDFTKMNCQHCLDFTKMNCQIVSFFVYSSMNMNFLMGQECSDRSVGGSLCIRVEQNPPKMELCQIALESISLCVTRPYNSHLRAALTCDASRFGIIIILSPIPLSVSKLLFSPALHITLYY